jgi:hypothetical protein
MGEGPRIAVRPPWLDEGMPEYDAFLLVSFGGPEGPDEVMPFLENVTRGRGIPRERLAGVAEHYYAVGGVSPINQQCRDLLAAIRADFGASGLSLPAYWGNRNWKPYLTDTVRTMAADGVRRAVAFVTSAYSSYSSCRQYLDDIERARVAAGPDAPHRQDQALLRPPRIHRAVRREHAGRPGRAPGRPAGPGPPGVHRAQRPGRDGRGERARSDPGEVRSRADPGSPSYYRTGGRRPSPMDPCLPEPERPAFPAVAGA